MYWKAIYARYQAASRPEKQRILDECCRVTRYHRKSALRLPLDILYVYDRVQRSAQELRLQRNVGQKSIRETEAKLALLGLRLRMRLDPISFADAVIAADGVLPP